MDCNPEFQDAAVAKPGTCTVASVPKLNFYFLVMYFDGDVFGDETHGSSKVSECSIQSLVTKRFLEILSK